MMKIKPLHKNFKLPVYATPGSACMDIYLPEDVVILPYSVTKIPLGFALDFPVGYEFELRPRSGLSLRYPNYIANSPATIDADYKDEVCLIFSNQSYNRIYFKGGDRICQMKLNIKLDFILNIVEEVDRSNDRGGGFCSTGMGEINE